MRSNYRSVSNTIQKLEKNIYGILSFTVVLSTKSNQENYYIVREHQTS